MKELFEAIRAGDLSRVKALVDADPSLAIFAAAIQGDTARIEELLAANRSLVSAFSRPTAGRLCIWPRFSARRTPRGCC